MSSASSTRRVPPRWNPAAARGSIVRSFQLMGPGVKAGPESHVDAAPDLLHRGARATVGTVSSWFQPWPTARDIGSSPTASARKRSERPPASGSRATSTSRSKPGARRVHHPGTSCSRSSSESLPTSARRLASHAHGYACMATGGVACSERIFCGERRPCRRIYPRNARQRRCNSGCVVAATGDANTSITRKVTGAGHAR